MSDGGYVGRVVGTEDATPLSYWVALAPGQSLQLDDVVVAERTLPSGETVRIAGMVTEMRARHEGARFDSDVFLIEEGILPAETVEAAGITTTRVEPEIYVPPLPGTEVRVGVGKERDHALYFDQMDKKLPIGVGRDGDALFANLESIDGTRGAHINISGISGVATKTTYATFLLYSLFHSGILGGEAINTKALIFNVKGEDLLFLDHPNAQLTEGERQRYRVLGLEPGAFSSVAVYAPPKRGRQEVIPDVVTRTTGVHPYYWTIAEFCQEELLPFVFADAEDERQQYTMVIHNVAHRLKHEGQPVGDDGAYQLEGQTIRIYQELVDFLSDRLLDEDPAIRAPWAGQVTTMGTIQAFMRRLWSSIRPLSHLIRADVKAPKDRRIDESPANVTVVISTTCTIVPSASWSASPFDGLSRRRRSPGSPGRSCFWCSTSSTSTRLPRARPPSRRSSSTWPSEADRSVSSSSAPSRPRARFSASPVATDISTRYGDYPARMAKSSTPEALTLALQDRMLLAEVAR